MDNSTGVNHSFSNCSGASSPLMHAAAAFSLGVAITWEGLEVLLLLSLWVRQLIVTTLMVKLKPSLLYKMKLKMSVLKIL